MNEVFLKTEEHQHDTGVHVIIRQDRWTPLAAGTRGAILCSLHCPGCNKEGAIGSLTHTVNQDGEVSPSVICGHMDCEWEGFIKLQGWRG